MAPCGPLPWGEVKLKRIVDWGDPTAGLTPSACEPEGVPVVPEPVVPVAVGVDELGGPVPGAPVLVLVVVVVFELCPHPVSATANAIAVAVAVRYARARRVIARLHHQRARVRHQPDQPAPSTNARSAALASPTTGSP